MRFDHAIAVASASIFLVGCSTGSDAIMQTMRAVWSRNDASQAKLNPDYRYLRVVVDGRVVLLALGNVEGSRDKPVEVWYSAQKEVLRLQDGRLVGAVGSTTEWRKVSLPALPDWKLLTEMKQFQWVRIRDVMPGYRIGIRDDLLLRRIEPPLRTELMGIPVTELSWFEESVAVSSAADKLPTARYALDIRGGKAEVVYGEQCLDVALCFSWQHWPLKSGI